MLGQARIQERAWYFWGDFVAREGSRRNGRVAHT
jgi:hypothetical protein